MSNQAALNTVGERLRFARFLSGETGEELGAIAGLSKSTVQMIESGARLSPTTRSIGALARVLGVSADWLIAGAGEEPEKEEIVAAVKAARESAAKARPATPKEPAA